MHKPRELCLRVHVVAIFILFGVDAVELAAE